MEKGIQEALLFAEDESTKELIPDYGLFLIGIVWVGFWIAIFLLGNRLCCKEKPRTIVA